MNGLIAFYDDMVPPARLVEQMDGLGVRVEPVIECLPTLACPCVVLGKASLPRILQGMSEPARGFIEWVPGDQHPASNACIECADVGGLGLAVNTRIAYQIDVAQQFTQALATRFPATLTILGDIELSLAEAVANAIIHGNLGIGSQMRNDFQGFALFQATLLERLDDPCRAGRKIEITARPLGGSGIRIAVLDQGDGYDIHSQMNKSARIEAKSGRGLGLIRQLADRIEIGLDGRLLTMDFGTKSSATGQ